MTKSEALKRSIEIAVERGWLGVIPKKTMRLDVTATDMETRVRITYMLPNSKKVETYEQFISNALLLDRAYLKALFGEERLHKCGGKILTHHYFAGGEPATNWYCEKCDTSFDDMCLRRFSEEDFTLTFQYHTHAMLDYVLEGKDPLDYLVEYLGKESK